MADRCPKCGSYDTETHYAMKTAGVIVDLLIGIGTKGKVPSNASGATKTHSCNNCHHQWGW